MARFAFPNPRHQRWWGLGAALAVGGVIIVVRWVCSRRAQKQEQSDESEVVEEGICEEPAQLVVEEQDWSKFSEHGFAFGQEAQPSPDQALELIVERCLPCDAVDILEALYKPGSAFWAHWQALQHHQNVSQGDWHKQSTPLGTQASCRIVRFILLLVGHATGSVQPLRIVLIALVLSGSLIITNTRRLYQLDERMQLQNAPEPFEVAGGILCRQYRDSDTQLRISRSMVTVCLCSDAKCPDGQPIQMCR
jgi:hypothetical protein